MIFEICAIAATIIFALLAFYTIRTLLILQETLRSIEYATKNVDDKIKHMDSTLKAVSELGDLCREKMLRFKEREILRADLVSKENTYTEDLAEMVLAGLRLAIKFFRRE